MGLEAPRRVALYGSWLVRSGYQDRFVIFEVKRAPSYEVSSMLGQVCMAFKNDENKRRDFGGLQFCTRIIWDISIELIPHQKMFTTSKEI